MSINEHERAFSLNSGALKIHFQIIIIGKNIFSLQVHANEFLINFFCETEIKLYLTEF
jgi:hypothetical protein